MMPLPDSSCCPADFLSSREEHRKELNVREAKGREETPTCGSRRSLRRFRHRIWNMPRISPKSAALAGQQKEAHPRAPLPIKCLDFAGVSSLRKQSGQGFQPGGNAGLTVPHGQDGFFHQLLQRPTQAFRPFLNHVPGAAGGEFFILKFFL